MITKSQRLWHWIISVSLLMMIIFSNDVLTKDEYEGEHFKEIDSKSEEMPLTFEKLQKMITDHDIQSIDQLVAHLAKNYPSYSSRLTVMRTTQGIQEAPRILLYGKDAKLVMAFNGVGNTLETIEFNDRGKKFILKTVAFPKDPTLPNTKPHFSKANPRECLSCHQDPPRPNWGSYPLWPGAYGGNDDRVIMFPSLGKQLERFKEFGIRTVESEKQLREEARQLEEERESLKTFIEQSQNHPRFKHLYPFFTKNYQFEMVGDDEMDAVTRTRFASRPNLMLGKKLSRLNYERIAKEIRESPNYREFKYAIVAALLSLEYPTCGEITEYLPDKVAQAIRPSLEEIRQKAKTEPRGIEAIENLKYLFESRGIKKDVLNWSMTSREKPFIPGMMFNTGTPPVRVYGLIDVLKEGDPDLSFLPYDIFPASVDTPDPQKEAERLCKELKKRSLKAFERGPISDILAACRRASSEPISEIAGLMSQISEIDKQKILSKIYFPKQCIVCHVTGGVGPQIPFDDALKFFEYIKKDPTVLKDIQSRVDMKEGEAKMPPGGLPFSESHPEEYRKLLQTIKLLRENFLKE